MIKENTISVVLPIIEEKMNLSADMTTVFEVLKQGNELSTAELVDRTGFNKDKVLRLLKKLKEVELVETLDKGRSTKHRRVT